jgi:tRNA/rRNA methyltransferase
MFASDDPTRFILLHTSHGGNVGAAARAMKVMGFADLVLVRPRFADVLSREDTVAYASGAADVLTRARIVDSLAEALEGVTHACATAMTPRDFGPPAQAPRDALPALAQQPQRVAFVFGSERFGMANEDVWRCHSVLSIPTHPDYGSLNLAQAVQLIAYEWRQSLGGFQVLPATPPAEWAGARCSGSLAQRSGGHRLPGPEGPQEAAAPAEPVGQSPDAHAPGGAHPARRGACHAGGSRAGQRPA